MSNLYNSVYQDDDNHMVYIRRNERRVLLHNLNMSQARKILTIMTNLGLAQPKMDLIIMEALANSIIGICYDILSGNLWKWVIYLSKSTQESEEYGFYPDAHIQYRTVKIADIKDSKFYRILDRLTNPMSYNCVDAVNVTGKALQEPRKKEKLTLDSKLVVKLRLILSESLDIKAVPALSPAYVLYENLFLGVGGVWEFKE